MPGDDGVSNRKRDGGRMRREWDAMARDDAMRYITDGTVADEEAFFRSGEALVAGVLASVGYEPAPGEAALEIGCGLGRTVRALAARFARVVGVDVSEEMIRQARDLLADCPNVELVVGNGTDLGFAEDGAFAFCFSYIAFQHIPDRRIVAAYLREIARVLGPGGVACIQLHTQPPGPWAWLRDRLRRRRRGDGPAASLPRRAALPLSLRLPHSTGRRRAHGPRRRPRHRLRRGPPHARDLGRVPQALLSRQAPVAMVRAPVPRAALLRGLAGPGPRRSISSLTPTRPLR